MELSPREFALLHALASRPDTAVAKDELLRLVWGDEKAASRNVVEVYVGYVRRKLDAVGRRARAAHRARLRIHRRLVVMNGPSPCRRHDRDPDGRAGIPGCAAGGRGRTLRSRITLAVGMVSLIVLLALSRLGVGLLSGAVLDAADAELRAQAVTVAMRIAGGTPPAEVRGSQIRVVDNAGRPGRRRSGAAARPRPSCAGWPPGSRCCPAG